MKTISIDIETHSSVNLLKSGVYPYTEAPDFEIMLFGYSVDGGPVTVIDLIQGEEIPAEIRVALFDKQVIKQAWNANFEITCLSAHYGRQLPADQWRCSSVLALTLGMPGNLFDASRVCNLPIDKQKMGIGRSLIMYFCVPCKPTKKNGGRTRNYPHHDPAKWELFKEYCIRDVEAEMAIYEKLQRWVPNPFEQALWNLDQKINRRGWKIDIELVKAAIEIDAEIKAKLTAEFVALTGITKATQVAKLKKWLLDEHEIVTESLNKESIKTLLNINDDASVERVLQLRQQLSRSSVSKYVAMMRSVCDDGRIRGLFQFYGANRTGRWAGRLVQAHNLPKSDLAHEDLVLARELVLARAVEVLGILFGDVQALLSELIRTAFVAEKGKTFAVVDFSAIEARVVAWGAGCEWRMEVFRTHGKIYEMSASTMFKVPLESIGKKSPLRQKGKVAELACIAKGSPVLTDRGLVAIEDVTPGMRVWDGVAFVACDGAIFKGVKNVITYEGLTATPDHLVWVEGEPGPVQLGVAAASGSRLVCTGVGRAPIRLGQSDLTGAEIYQGLVGPDDADAVHLLRVGSVVEHGEPCEGKIEGLPGMLEPTPDSIVVGPTDHSNETALREPIGRGVQELRCARDPVSVRLSTRRRALDTCESWSAQGTGNRPEGQRGPLRTGEPSVPDAPGAAVQQTHIEAHDRGLLLGRIREPLSLQHDPKSARGGAESEADSGAGRAGGSGEKEELARDSDTPENVRVYDLLNCGPNNRFTVSCRLVHNCGYHGGCGALIAMGALKMGIPEGDLQGLVDAWREANPEIMTFGWDMEKNAKICLRKKIRTGVPGKYWFRYESGMLFMDLPSGRSLCYVKPRIEKVGSFSNITYDGMDPEKKIWGRADTYGGKFLENWTQAVARDILAVAMVRLDAADYDIVGHVHDEAVSEVDEATAEQALHGAEAILSQPIDWAPGLPLKGDGFISPFYKKDA